MLPPFKNPLHSHIHVYDFENIRIDDNYDNEHLAGAEIKAQPIPLPNRPGALQPHSAYKAYCNLAGSELLSSTALPRLNFMYGWGEAVSRNPTHNLEHFSPSHHKPYMSTSTSSFYSHLVPKA